jgi:hypothetical protein
MIVIVAGNYRSAKEYAKEHDLGPEARGWIYASRYSLKGRRGPLDVRYVGNEQANPSLKEILEDLQIIEATS